MNLDVDSRYHYWRGNISEAKMVLEANRRIAQGKDVAEARIKYGSVISDWITEDFYHGNLVLLHPDGRVRFPDSAFLEFILEEEMIMSEGGIVVVHKHYDFAEGREFSSAEVQKYSSGEKLTEKEARENLLWREILSGKNVQDEYVEMVSFDNGGFPAMEVKLNPSNHAVRAMLLRLNGRSKNFSMETVNPNNLGVFVGVAR